jgi:hypothetical protein
MVLLATSLALGAHSIVKALNPHIFKTQDTDHQREMNFFADHAAAAYGDEEYNRTLRQHGWKRVLEYCAEEFQTYTKDGKYVVAFRGTSVGRDYGTDVAVASGFHASTKRFKQSVQIADTILKAAEDGQQEVPRRRKVVFTGHSLGAALALHVAEKLQAVAVCYSTPQFRMFGNPQQKRSDILHFMVSTDPIAEYAWTASGKFIVIDQKRGAPHPHAMSNFTGTEHREPYRLRQGAGERFRDYSKRAQRTLWDTHHTATGSALLEFMLPTEERYELYIGGLKDAGLRQELKMYKDNHSRTLTMMDLIITAGEADSVLQTSLSHYQSMAFMYAVISICESTTTRCNVLGVESRQRAPAHSTTPCISHALDSTMSQVARLGAGAIFLYEHCKARCGC